MDFLEMLYQYVESYYESTQIPLSILDEDGSLLRRYGKSCLYCQQFKKQLGGDGICNKRHLHGCNAAAAQNQGYVFSCPGGLVHFAVSPKQNNRPICSILAGPLLLEFPQMNMVDDVLVKFKLPLKGRTALFSAMQTVTLAEPKQIKYLSRLLYSLTGHLPDMAQEIVEKQSDLEAQQARIDAYLEAIQEDEEAIQRRNYTAQLYDLEMQLISSLRMCNEVEAKLAMKELFALHCYSSGQRTNFITVRSIELITLLSRTAIEAGANVYKMYGKTDKFFKYLMDSESAMEISMLLHKAVGEAIQLIDVPVRDSSTSLIRQSIHYINQHYKENISLEDVSKEINLSTSYFSAIFKEETGLSFTHYINNLRIDAAKKMLMDTDVSLLDISLELGFGSQSYFSSVFKKNVAMSPKQFRTKMQSANVLPTLDGHTL